MDSPTLEESIKSRQTRYANPRSFSSLQFGGGRKEENGTDRKKGGGGDGHNSLLPLTNETVLTWKHFCHQREGRKRDRSSPMYDNEKSFTRISSQASLT